MILFKRRVVLWTIPSLLVGPAFVAGACGDSGSQGGGGGGAGGSAPDSLDDVIYEGGATDEALVELLKLTPENDSAQGTRFLAPVAGAELAAATPQEFQWEVGQQASLWRSLLGPSEAHAHGTPINGRAYFLVFSTPDKPKLLRVFTTLLSYTPDDAAWQKLVGAGEVTASVVNALFETNRVTQDGGPFQGDEISFTVA